MTGDLGLVQEMGIRGFGFERDPKRGVEDSMND